MEHEQQTESVGEFVKTKKIHENNTCQSNISSTRDSEDSAVECLNIYWLVKFWYIKTHIDKLNINLEGEPEKMLVSSGEYFWVTLYIFSKYCVAIG